jgi:hypothetical protein
MAPNTKDPAAVYVLASSSAEVQAEIERRRRRDSWLGDVEAAFTTWGAVARPQASQSHVRI